MRKGITRFIERLNLIKFYRLKKSRIAEHVFPTIHNVGIQILVLLKKLRATNCWIVLKVF